MYEKELPVVPRFRVWLPDPDVERMLKVKALVYEHDKTRCVCGYAYDFYLEDEDAIIMRSTGLLDKNGKEIFEGDVLSTYTDNLVIKRDNLLGFYVEVDEKREYFAEIVDIEYLDLFAKDFGVAVEVLGNIYENPELLGQ